MGDVRVTVVMPEEWAEWLREVAAERRTTVSALVRDAVSRMYSFERTPEDEMLSKLFLPEKGGARDVYIAILRRYLRKEYLNINMGVYDVLASMTGLSSNTVQEKVKQLAQSGFIRTEGWNLRPVLKWKIRDEKKKDDLLAKYREFLMMQEVPEV